MCWHANICFVLLAQLQSEPLYEVLQAFLATPPNNKAMSEGDIMNIFPRFNVSLANGGKARQTIDGDDLMFPFGSF